MHLKTKLVSYTQPAIEIPASGAEDLVAFCARVSSGRDYDERAEDYEGLLNYCARNAHWSVFQMADATVEVEVPRDISRQALRHQSFDFQEFSQRYSDGIEFTVREIRKQDNKNRQNSIDLFTKEEKWEFEDDCHEVIAFCMSKYEKWQKKGGAKECCRVFLPEGLTVSKFYMKGSLRSWIHYLDVREGNGTQLEHIWLAKEVRKVLLPVFPTVLGGT